MKKLLVPALLLLTTLLTIPVYGHGGRTNAQGCHNQKSTGGYHCHNSGKHSAASSTSHNQSIHKCTDSNGKISFTDTPCNSNSQSYVSAFGDVTPSNKDLMRLNYDGFIVWLDCSKRGAVKFQYNAQRDTGNFKRSSKFYLDSKVPKNCQQYSAKTYKAKGKKYDRGHLVPANHLDYSKTAIKASNSMTNILPQAANMNRGAWLMTEEITECYRDIDELLIIGGVIWGNNSANDYFVTSHGVKTPDAFWKVIIRGIGADERVIAWIIPNSQDAKRASLDHYIVTVAEIERVTGDKIPVADYAKHDKPSVSWALPRGCNKG